MLVMTVSSTTRRAGPYHGNGVTIAFPFAFKVFAASDLSLTVADTTTGDQTPLTLGTNYTVTLNADQDTNPGGTINYPVSGSPLAVGKTLVGVGTMPYVQPMDIINAGRFLPQAFEDALDRQAIAAQQLAEKQDRTLRYPVADAGAQIDLPSTAGRSDRLLAFNVGGQPGASDFTQTQLASAIAAAYMGAAGPLDALSFIQSGVDALARTAQDKAREVFSVKDFGAKGNGIADDTTDIQKAIDAVSGSVSTYRSLYFPDGVYCVSSTIVQKLGVTLVLDKNAIIKATAPMAALIQTPAATAIFDVGIYGGRLHCEDLADVGLDVQWFQHYKLQDTYIQNFLVAGARFGVAGTAYSSYEAIVRGLKTFRNQNAIPANSIDLHLRTATDCKISQCVLVAGETGVRCDSGGHWLEQVHAWARATYGVKKYGFDDQAGTNTYVGCFADTPNVAGWRIAFGNTALIGCRVFMSDLGGVDNTADGVLITSAVPNATIIGFVCVGSTALLRFKNDVNYAAVTDPYSSLFLLGNVTNNCVTAAPSIQRNMALLGLWLGGVRRMDFSLDGAGNLNVKRRDGTASLLGTPIVINNASGQVSFQDSGIDTKGTYDKPTTIGGLRTWVDPNTNLLRGKAANPANATDGSPLLLKKLTGTTDPTPGTPVTVAHGLGYAPTFVILGQRGNGTSYQSAGADAVNVTISGTAASLNFDVYVG